ncbi:hypothetical protein RKE29_17945 [Streptomyces sp. B1866]|uniref:hypothetical protein n=1 Tax=Streptomyces sp. B1866 TaxID=3075431 RepID=UPI00288F9ECC|nr:hypothetical protein [Streptomyces sp. B1866]MDT3398508.1 hypothetical protein [Streptomyces sp. B1866]
MDAHTAAAPRHGPRRHHGRHPHLSVPAAWAVPLLLGLCYGAYAGFLDHEQGASAAGATVLGVVAAAVTAALCRLVGRWQARLMPELRATAYGALTGAAVGYLHSLSGADHPRSVVLGLLLGLGTGIASFYVFYTHAD